MLTLLGFRTRASKQTYLQFSLNSKSFDPCVLPEYQHKKKKKNLSEILKKKHFFLEFVGNFFFLLTESFENYVWKLCIRITSLRLIIIL